MAILLTTVRSESDTTLGHRINRAAFVSPQLITRHSDDTQTFRSVDVKRLIFSHIIENESVVQRIYVQVVTQRKHPHLLSQPTQLLNPVSKAEGSRNSPTDESPRGKKRREALRSSGAVVPAASCKL